MIQHLLFLMMANWENLMAHLANNYGTCKLLVYSHSNSRHAKIVAQAIDASFNKMIQVEIYEEVFIDEKRLEAYTFDLLLTTTTLNLDIKQPIAYILGTKSNINFPLLSKIIEETRTHVNKEQRAQLIENTKKLDPDLFDFT